MADYFVSSAGSNTSPYDTWAKAATSLQAALDLATGTTPHRVAIDVAAVPTADKDYAGDKTWTIKGGDVSIIASTNTDTATITPTEMGTSTWLGNGSAPYNLSLGLSTHAIRGYVYGVTFRTHATSNKQQTIGANSYVQLLMEKCLFWGTGTNATGIYLGSRAVSPTVNRLVDCTLRTASTSTSLITSGRVTFENFTVSNADGAVPSVLFNSGDGDHVTQECIGCDLSLVTGTLVPNTTGGHRNYYFRQCKIGSGVTVMAAQTWFTSTDHTDVWLFDCDSGDVHYRFGHYNALGSTVTSTAVYANTGAQYDVAGDRCSWLINTTSIVSERFPYITPVVACYNDGVSAITPYIECVRSGSATAYKNNEVWAEFTYKGTSGSTKATFDRSDHGTGSDQTASALGAGDWTGENGTAWFGRLAPSSAITPAEIGDMTARIVVGAASVTDLYVDPQIRGRT